MITVRIHEDEAFRNEIYSHSTQMQSQKQANNKINGNVGPNIDDVMILYKIKPFLKHFTNFHRKSIDSNSSATKFDTLSLFFQINASIQYKSISSTNLFDTFFSSHHCFNFINNTI